MGANEKQVGGNHYKKQGATEHWDIVDQWGLDYFQGQITKYVMRWRDKGGLQDLEKASHFLEKYREVETRKALAKSIEGIGKAIVDAPAPDLIVASPEAMRFWRRTVSRKAGKSKKVSRRKVPVTRKK